MNILYFSVNSKHFRFFSRILESGCKGMIVSSGKLWLVSLRSLFSFPDFLYQAASLRTKDFKAKYGLYTFHPFIYGMNLLLAYWCYIRYSRIISAQYTHIMVWNSSLFRQSIAVGIAKQYGLIPIVAEAGLLPNRIVVDMQGANFLNSVPRTRSFFESYYNPDPLPDSLIPRKPKNARKFLQTAPITLPENYVFVPFQVDYDTQILLFSPWIKNMEMLFDLIERVSRSLRIHFVFKEHPSSKKSYPKLHQKAEKNPFIHFANGNTTQMLIESAQAVITVNSTVGIESLLFQKRVIVLGDAFYAIDGIAKEVKDEHTLIDVLATLSTWKINHDLIENFLKYLYYDYLIEGNIETFNITQVKKRIGCH